MGNFVRQKVQKHDEHVLVEPFHDEFEGRFSITPGLICRRMEPSARWC